MDTALAVGARVDTVANGAASDSRLGAGWARTRRHITGLVLALSAGLVPALALAADPQVASLVDNPDPVAGGGTYTYTVRVDNNAVDAATNTRLTVQVPSGASFVSASPADANCVAASATSVQCSLGTLGALGADVRTVVLTWRATVAGPAVVTATATVTADNDSNTANNSQTDSTTVIEGADLALAKAGTPSPVPGGGVITYTLTATNNGPNAGGAMVITDTLPPSVSFLTASGAGWTCSHASGVVSCARPGTLAVGASAPVVTVTGRVTAAGGNITNSAVVEPATGGVADPVPNNNVATVDTPVIPGADVRIAQKSVTSAQPATAGGNVSFQIQPRNGGPSHATNAVVIDTLPAGWGFVSASGAGWSCSASGQEVRCTRASLPLGNTDNITVVASAPATVAASGSSFTNTASIGSDTPDGDSGNNSGSVAVLVRPDGADLRLTKTKTPNPVALGSNMVSTITVANGGPRVATGPLRVVEVLSGEAFVSATGTGWSCSLVSGAVVCEHANMAGLAVNASLPTLRITTQATAAGAARNEACTGASLPAGGPAGQARPPVEGDANPGNDCATVTSTSTSTRPDLAIAKTTSTLAGGDKIVGLAEDRVTYTLVVSNVSAGADGATGVRFTDSVPGFLTGRTTFGALTPVVSGGSSATFACSANSAGTVTCTQNGGTLAPGESVSVAVAVNRPLADGSFTNTATVTNTAEGDPNSANNSAQDTVVILPIADVVMTGKSVTPGSVRAGENVIYVLSSANNGPSTAEGVVVGDVFSFANGADTGFTVVSIGSTRSGSTCSIAAGAQVTPAAPGFSCTIGTLASGDTESITVVMRPNFMAGNPARTVTNTASVTTTSTENPDGGNNNNNSRNASLTIQPALLNLLTNKTDLVDPLPFYLPGSGPSGGSFLHYQVTVSNTGPSYGTGVRITEVMTPPAGHQVRFICDTTTYGGSTCNSPPLCSVANVLSASGTALPAFTCDVPAGSTTTGLARGELAAGQAKPIFLRFEAINQPAPTGDVFRNVATASANEPDSNSSNDSASEPTTLRQRVDLRVSKTGSVATVVIHQPFNWTVTVLNNGPGNSLVTDLTDTLPLGAELTGPVTFTRLAPPGGDPGAGSASGTCSASGRTITCNLGQLNAGGTATVTVPARFTSLPTGAGGTAVNNATVDTSPAKTGGVDTPGGNNTGTHTVTVTPASLAGLVFQDRDRAGANGGTPQGAGVEPRLGGVVVRLTGTDAFGNAIDRSTTTAADGSYSFAALPPSGAGGYAVTQTQPAGFANSPVAPPNSGGLAPTAGGSYSSGGGTGNSSYSGVVLSGTAEATQYNFPEVRQPSLSGFVYVDGNLDGVRDASSDAAIPNAVVRLLNAATGALVATATTDSTGAYSFTGLDPMVVYTLEEPLPASPANLANGPVNPGLVNGLACSSGCTAQANAPVAGTDRITGIDLSAGLDGTLFNFGERQLASISGLVYVDADRNNSLGGSDAGRIPGVVVRLVQGADCTSGTVLQTTTTGADGGFRFDNVVTGAAYLVCQTQPAAYGNGNANGAAGSNSISIAVLAAGGSANNLFGELAASLAGTVYQDNGTDVAVHVDNGVKDAGEVGIANVQVTVTGTDVLGNAVNRSAVTDANGNWRVDGLLAADASGYTVVEGAIPPAAGRFVDGRETAGSAGGNATAVNDRISAVALAAGQQASGYLFGELGIAPISGTVYVDLNRNGAIDPLPTDGRIPGVTLNLVRGTDCSAAPVATTVTGATGNYSFSGAAAGLTYTVCQVQPDGYQQGGENPGTGNTGSTNAITITNLSSGGSSGNHFGEIASNSVLEGKVWLDADNSGTVNGSEAGIAGVVIELTGTDNAGNVVTRTGSTDASGQYRFEALPPGTYTVREPSQPAGTLNGTTVAGGTGGTVTAPGTAPSAITAITLGWLQTSSGNNFGELPPALVSGRVYADNNDNGRIDSTESGLSGVVVLLTGTDDTGTAVSRSATTGADGGYAFDNLRPGRYTLTEPTQPAGTVNGQTTAGTLGGTATAPNLAPSAISDITLPPGGQSTANNFGEIGTSPDLRVAKSHSPTTVTVNNRFIATLAVRNAGELATTGAYTVSDRLLGGMALAAAPTGAGWTCTGAAGDTAFSCSSSTVLAAGASAAPITATLRVGADALARSPLQNLVLVEGGGELPARGPGDAERAAFQAGDAAALPVCEPAILHNVCRDPAVVQASASISGTAWFDSGATPRQLDAGDRRLPGWTVEILDTAGTVVATATTAADGSWQIADLLPGVPLQVRYRHPETGVAFGYPVNGDSGAGSSGVGCDPDAATKGLASSCARSSGQPVLDVVLAPGRLLPQQSLPLGVDPSGVLYDAIARTPVGGATVTLSPTPGASCPGWDPRTQVAGATMGGYTVQGSAISMPVGSDGIYQFLFLANAPGRCSFTISVTPPDGYTAPSALIPASSTPLVVPEGPGTLAVQPQAGPPATGSTTTWYTTVETGSRGPAIVHNHIPLDPVLPGGISLQKTGDRAVAELGDTVRYSITVQLTSGARPRQTTVVDRLPAGFTYIAGTAMVDGVRVADPVGANGPNFGPVLAFNLGPMPATNRQVLQYRVRLGVGSQQGDGINRARAHACSVPAGCVGPDGRTPIGDSVPTNEGQHRVQVTGGVFAAEACLLGKVFVDCNGNHVQDREELGVPGVRLLLTDGTNLISDSEGKYSVCGLPPRSHVLRIDPHTLPRGSRLTTSSNRNLGEAGSLWLDLKNGELHRADFIEGSCSNTVLDQVKARRAQGEVRAPETERAGQPALRFDSKAHGLDAIHSPAQGTDGANQQAPKPRATDAPPARGAADGTEQHLPTPALPMNRPPPTGRSTSQAPDADNGGRDAKR